MEIVALIGRIIFSFMFIYSGVNHFKNRQYMTEYAASAGVPSPASAIPVSGTVLLLGGFSVLLGIWGDLGGLLLVVFLLPTAFYMHAFWKVDDPQMAQQQQIHFFKNVTMAGGALMTTAWYLCSSALSVTGPLFN